MPAFIRASINTELRYALRRGARDAKQFFTDVVGVKIDDLLAPFALFFLVPLGFAFFADLFVQSVGQGVVESSTMK